MRPITKLGHRNNSPSPDRVASLGPGVGRRKTMCYAFAKGWRALNSRKRFGRICELTSVLQFVQSQCRCNEEFQLALIHLSLRMLLCPVLSDGIEEVPDLRGDELRSCKGRRDCQKGSVATLAAQQPSPRWSMVLSHHPPSQYDRTLHFAGRRWCARCSGALIGVLAGALIFSRTPMLLQLSVWHLAGIALFTLSLGIVAFVRNESGSRQSNNYERIVFGFALGCLFPVSWALSPWYFGALLLLIVLGQFISAIALRRAGLLDSFFAQYLDGAMIWPVEEESDAMSCGRIFCNCKPGALKLPRV